MVYFLVESVNEEKTHQNVKANNILLIIILPLYAESNVTRFAFYRNDEISPLMERISFQKIYKKY